MSSVSNGEESRDWVDRTWPFSRASAQVRLVLDAYAAAGITIGVHLTGGEVDFLYQEGALLIRDDYVDRVRSVVGGGEVMDRLAGGVTHFSLAGARMATVTAALAAVDSRVGAVPRPSLGPAAGPGCPPTWSTPACSRTRPRTGGWPG